MSPTPASPGPVRPLAEINDAIRALVLAGRAGSEEHEALLAEWLRATVVPAA
ncbi:hypothetical protein ACFWIB_14870 [Streptomyces sp. NPDC127051]|uniref:hypothetical protein n=1 Tax=Streptomyces sp. NPDC127051 TaxID=3347119 RepID=UPI0036595A0F